MARIAPEPRDTGDLGYPDTVDVTIRDSRPSAIGWTASTATARESSRTVTLTLKRTGDLSSEAFVGVRTQDETATANQDYAPIDTVVRFAPRKNQATVRIPVVNDRLYEGDEYLLVQLLNQGTPLGVSQVRVRLQDDDKPARPVWTDAAAVVTNGQLTAVTLGLPGTYKANQLWSPRWFTLKTAGKDGRIGTRDDTAVPIANVTQIAPDRVRIDLAQSLAAPGNVQIKVQASSIRDVVNQTLKGTSTRVLHFDV